MLHLGIGGHGHSVRLTKLFSCHKHCYEGQWLLTGCYFKHWKLTLDVNKKSIPLHLCNLFFIVIILRQVLFNQLLKLIIKCITVLTLAVFVMVLGNMWWLTFILLLKFCKCRFHAYTEYSVFMWWCQRDFWVNIIVAFIV